MDTITEPFLAPAPTPHTKPLGMLGFVLTASRNPIEIWGSRAFKEPYLKANWLRVPTVIVNDPAGIRRRLLLNRVDGFGGGARIGDLGWHYGFLLASGVKGTHFTR